jgi:hypothetical protein
MENEDSAMKKIVLFLMTAMVLLLSRQALAEDYSGTWIGTVTETLSHCKDLGKAEPGDYLLTITQKGNDIMIMENVNQRPFKGKLRPEDPRHVHVRATYTTDGGYVTELVDIDFVNAESGTGGSVWRWSDGYYECGGSFKFTLKKKPEKSYD